MIRFTVPGKPIAKGRPRMTTQGGKARSFTPARTVNYESLVAMAGDEAMDGRDLLEGPIDLNVTAHFPIAKSWPKARQQQARSGILWHTSRPDASNLLKAVEDGLNGIVWGDDAQVASCRIIKVYSDIPRVDVMVTQLAEGPV